jgi:hypothetical protein
MMDWSRCCNSLVNCPDGIHQVGVFGRELNKYHYYSAVTEGPARAMVCTWDETEDWLKEDAANGKGKRVEEVPQKEPKAIESDLNGSLAHHQPTKIITQPQSRKEKEPVDSPRSPNTFPGDSVRSTMVPPLPGQSSKSRTFANLRTKVSLPQLRKLFNKKAPPMPLVKHSVGAGG